MTQTIWIIGASSGIGKALALAYHQQKAHLILSARRTEELEALNRSMGGQHQILPCDVADADSMQKAAQQLPQQVDCVLYLAATYAPLNIAEIEAPTMSKIVDVNLKGVFHFIEAALPYFLRQGKGQIAICGSVAGYRGLPKAQPYGATKAAVINLVESLRIEHGDQLDIRLISPGFVKTPMTDKNDFTMPMMIEPDAAAHAIIKGLKGNAFEIHFPKNFTYILKLLRTLPDKLYFWAAGKAR